METLLEQLHHDEVFKHFLALTKIPRESGNEKAVSDYCVAFALGLGLEVIQEESLNVIIRKPASIGYENHPMVILQGHLDMVCVKEDALTFDFKSEPIPLVIEDDFLKTKGTTLGADNGIAVAMIMAILSSDKIQHPPIEALFTVEEETGMGGVMALDPKHVTGEILINLDAEEEGVVYTSCAGGVNNILSFDIETMETTKTQSYTLVIQGLKGGHSGIEINQHRANALKLLGRTLSAFEEAFAFDLITLRGGEKMNAIAKYAEMTFAVDDHAVGVLTSEVERLNKQFLLEHLGSDQTIELKLMRSEPSKIAYTETLKKQLTQCLVLMPFGVQTMSSTIEGLVESSSNLGILSVNDTVVELTNSVRSSIVSLKQEISNRVKLIAELTGANWHQISDYPAWAYRADSPIRDLMQQLYEAMNHHPLKVDAIHAGLECGFLSEKLGDIDMIAMGPDMFDVHTPKERVNISSVKRVYAFLLEVLKHL
jgi:dipeptidase D